MTNPKVVSSLASTDQIDTFAGLDRALVLVLVVSLVWARQREVSYFGDLGPHDSGQNTFGLGISENILVGSLLSDLKLIRRTVTVLVDVLIRDRIRATHRHTELPVTCAVRYRSLVALEGEVLRRLLSSANVLGSYDDMIFGVTTCLLGRRNDCVA